MDLLQGVCCRLCRNAAWWNPFACACGPPERSSCLLGRPQATNQKEERAKGPWVHTDSSSSEFPLTPTSQGPLSPLSPGEAQGSGLLAWAQSPVSSSKRTRLTLFCFPRENVLLQQGLARPVGSGPPCGFPLSLSACSKLSSWRLLSKGHISYAVSLELLTLDFVFYVVCG